MRVSIRGLGKAVPDRVVTNAEIAERLGVDPDWIESRTGIRERRFVGPGESTATLGTAAARQALERAGLEPSDVDCVVVGTCFIIELTFLDGRKRLEGTDVHALITY